jgi:molybdopterin-guanine dinucleotide biosynthesis protein A
MRQAAAILAGGASRRMGQDKALLRLEGDSAPLLARVVDRVASLVDELFIVSPDREDYRRFGAPIVTDRFPGEGPLGGIVTALGATQCDWCLIVACDMPFLNGALLRWMIGLRGDAEVIVPVTPGESRQGRTDVAHIAHALYRVSALPAIECLMARGERQAAKLLTETRAIPIGVEQLVRFDPGLRSLFSVNTPADLELASRWLRTEMGEWDGDTIY